MQTATLSANGQIVVPAEIRAQLGFAEGDRLAFAVEGQRLIIERMPSRAERRKARMTQAFADYAASASEKVWASIDGEDFVGG